VKKKRPEGLVDLEVWIEGVDGVTVPATASVALPARA
jgi:hypothetical protein